MDESRKSYAEAFERIAASLPPASRSLREQSLRAFTQQGFPHKKLEDWRYTDLSSLAAKSFALASGGGVDLDAYRLAGTAFQSYVNGGGGALSPLPAEGDAITALNTALAREGFSLHLKAGQRSAQPVHVLTYCESAQPVMAHLRHRIRLDAGTEATVILQHAGRGEYFTTQLTEIELGAHSRLTLYRLQGESAQSYHLAQTRASLAQGSHLCVINIDLGDGLARQDLSVSLDGPGAEVQLHGLFAPAGRAHVDNHTRIDHRAERCISREYFRGLAFDHARGVFNGKIVVHPGAQKTDSEQRIANLVLSKTAEINAKPELEIYADDVKCAHGATFGQLDQDAIFYLRSRGLDRDAAQTLLTYTFAQHAIGRIGHEELRRRVTQGFLSRLPQGAQLAGIDQ
jgi:Fe-S cluster assembly protein SufD